MRVVFWSSLMILNMWASIVLFLVRLLVVDHFEGLEDVRGQFVDEFAPQVEFFTVFGLDRQVENLHFHVLAVVPPRLVFYVSVNSTVALDFDFLF